MWCVMSLLACLLVLVALGEGGAADGGQRVSGFPSLDEVRGNGSLLMNTTIHRVAYERVFPAMTFTCNGTVTKWTFVALRGERNRGLSQLKLLRMSSPERPHLQTYYHTAPALNTSSAVPVPGSVTGYELTGPHHQLSFQAGDVLGIFQQRPAEHLFVCQLGVEIEICRRSGSSNNYHCEENGNFGRPLVAVETEPAGCAQGFMDGDVLRHVMASTSVTAYPGAARPIRPLRFTCSATVISIKWTVGAKINEEGTAATTINIYGESMDLLIPLPLLSLKATPYLNVYEYESNSLVQVFRNNHIGLDYQPNSTTQIYYQRYGLTQSADLPLISVSVEGCVCPGGCAERFIGLEELRKQAQYIPNFDSDFHEGFIVLPHMNISQDGYIVKWTFTAVDQGRGDEFPNLLILRPTSEDTIHCLNGSESVLTGYPNVYEYTTDSPLPVEAGDFIAIEQPPEDTAQLLLSFVWYAGPEGEHMDDSTKTKRDVNPIQGKEGSLPLVTLEVIGSIQVTPSSTVTLDIHTTSVIAVPAPSMSLEMDYTSVITPPAPSMSLEMDYTSVVTPPASSMSLENIERDSNTATVDGGVISGAVAAIVISGVLAVGIVALIMLLLWRKRGKKGSATHPPVDNPIYSGEETRHGNGTSTGSLSHGPTSLYAEVSEPEIYTEPNTASNGHAERTADHPITSPDYSYAVPEQTATPTPAEALQNHYEFALYVPTKEQRQQATDQSNVYATLEETQVPVLGQSPTFFEECEVYWKPASKTDELYAQLSLRKYREIPRHQIQTTDHLGSGQFGTVKCGVWQCQQTAVEVAVKMLQPGAPEEDAVRFLQEAAINGQFRHPNIVQLLGVVTVGKPVMIVTELVHNGDLRKYLLSNYKLTPGELPPSDTPHLLSQFCLQVAMGMEYLGRKAFVHRDLAARNILVTKERTCKISDFGMSRDLEEGSYYISHGGNIPVKWTAPEALHYKKYSTASDVWSFGCLMYEIWSLGHKPFEGYTNRDAMQAVDTGYRLPPPPGCPKKIYQLMIQCWHPDKSSRPQFLEIVEVLSLPELELLSIPEEEGRVHPQATLLGAPLEAGKQLYLELQNTYMQQ